MSQIKTFSHSFRISAEHVKTIIENDMVAQVDVDFDMLDMFSPRTNTRVIMPMRVSVIYYKAEMYMLKCSQDFKFA